MSRGHTRPKSKRTSKPGALLPAQPLGPWSNDPQPQGLPSGRGSLRRVPQRHANSQRTGPPQLQRGPPLPRELQIRDPSASARFRLQGTRVVLSRGGATCPQ